MMNNYGRLEINLLPPEMLPGPTVRYAMLINIMITLAAVAFIGVSLYVNLLKLNTLRENRSQLEQQINMKMNVEEDYNRLNAINLSIQRYGRLVSLASDDYIDMPVILDRMSKIIPDEVFLQRVANGRTQGQGKPVVLDIVLSASDDDPDLVLKTLQAFKRDEMFAECYMPAAEYKEVALTDLMERLQIDWSVSGPDVPNQIIGQHFEFEILAQLSRPLAGVDLAFEFDTTETLLESDPLAESRSEPTAPASDSGEVV